MVEVIGYLTKHLDGIANAGAMEGDMDQEKAMKRVRGLLLLLEERMLDTSSYVRTKVLVTLASLWSDLSPMFYSRQRLSSMRVAIIALHDLTGTTRKSAISLLIKLIQTHGWQQKGWALNPDLFQEVYEELQKKLDDLDAKVGTAVKNMNGENEGDEGSQSNRSVLASHDKCCSHTLSGRTAKRWMLTAMT